MLKINNFVYEIFSTLFSLFLQFCLFTYALMFTTFSVYFLSELTMFMMLGLNLKSELNLDFNSELFIKLLLRLFRLFIITKKFAILIERLQIFIYCLHVPNLGKTITKGKITIFQIKCTLDVIPQFVELYV